MKNEPKTNSLSHAANAGYSSETASFPGYGRGPARTADQDITRGTGLALTSGNAMRKDTKNNERSQYVIENKQSR
jgi:hypothetical protein